MQDLAAYNDGCKAVSLLITILANVVIYRLLTRGRPWITKQTHTHAHTYTPIKNLFRFNLDALTVTEALVNTILIL